MSKIICDVCGTSYPDTAAQCPICGCVRHVPRRHRASSDIGENEAAESGAYTYVKGGRFSKSNVRKRERSAKKVVSNKIAPSPVREKSGEEAESSKGLTIAVIALLLAIVAVVLYIMLHFFVPDLFTVKPKDPNPAGTSENSNTDGSDNAVDTGIDCTDISVDVNEITLKEKNSAYLLNVTVTPEDSTCDVVFESSNEAVATVTTGGKVTAIGEGEAIITITCGDQQTQCKVVCDFEENDPDNPDNPDDPDDPVDPPVSVEGFTFNRDDFTISVDDGTWKLYTGDVPVDQITWRSDDENVAIIKDGVVRATGNGYTYVYAEYDGVVLGKCIVRCDGQDPSNNDLVAGAPDGSYMSDSDGDATIKVGETFNLYLYSAEGYAVQVEWKCDDNGCTISGNRITGAIAGRTEVYAEYNGYVHKCIVRVKAG